MAKQNVTVELFYDDEWHEVTALAPSAVGGQPIVITRGQQSEGMAITPSRITFSLDNSDGNANFRNPSSPLYGKVQVAKPGQEGTPVRVTVGASVRGVGELVSATPEHSDDGKHSWVRIEAAGILQRLGQDTRPPRSALYRAVTQADEVVGYWPLEDILEHPDVVPAGVGSPGRMRDAGSAIITPMLWSADNQLPGSGALPVLASERGTAGVEAPVRGIDGSQPFSLEFWTRTELPEKTGTNGMFTQATLRVFVHDPTDTVGSFSVNLIAFPPGSDSGVSGGDEETVWVTGSVESPSGSILDRVIVEDLPFTNQWRHVYGHFSQNGDDVAVALYLDDVQVATGTLEDTTLLPVGSMRMGVFTQDSTVDQVGRVSVGHPVIQTAASTATLLFNSAAFGLAAGGHVGETPEERIVALCGEEDVTLAVLGTDDGPPMGPQPPATFMDLLRQCVATSRGSLFDHREAVSLRYRTLRSTYSQDAQLALDYDQGHVTPPLLPVFDDAATVEADTSTVNTMYPDLTEQVEGWADHIAGFDAARFPLIRVDLVANSSLVSDFNALELGDRVTITNLPDFIAPDDVNALVVGIKETIGTHTRVVDLTCIPEEPFHVAEVAHEAYGMIGSDSATLDSAVDSTSTLLTVDCGAGPDWVHEANFDVIVGGERMTVVSIGAATGTFPARTQSWLVSRSVNGVVKSHDAGTTVKLFHQTYIGL